MKRKFQGTYQKDFFVLLSMAYIVIIFMTFGATENRTPLELNIAFIIMSLSTVLYFSVIFLFFLLKFTTKTAFKGILYELLTQIFYFIVVSWLTFSMVYEENSKSAPIISIGLISVFALLSSIWLIVYSKALWRSGVITDSKKWNIKTMRYSIVEERIYNPVYKPLKFRLNHSLRVVLELTAGIILIAYFALYFSPRNKEGLLFFNLIFKDNPELSRLSTSIVVSIFIYLLNFFGLLPSIAGKVLEIIKISKYQKIYNKKMLIKERRSWGYKFKKNVHKLNDTKINKPFLE